MNNEMLILNSNIALILFIIPVTIHGVEAFLPMQARWVTNWVLPFFGLMLPNREKFLTYDEQIKMLDSALETASPEKQRSASDFWDLDISDWLSGMADGKLVWSWRSLSLWQVQPIRHQTVTSPRLTK